MLLTAMSISGALSLVEAEANAPLEEATQRAQGLKALVEAHLLDLRGRRLDLLYHLSRDPELSTALRTFKPSRGGKRSSTTPLEPILHRLTAPYNRGAWLLLDGEGRRLAQINADEAQLEALAALPVKAEAPSIGQHQGDWLLSVPIEGDGQPWRLAHAYPIPFEALERFAQHLQGEFKWFFFLNGVARLEPLKGLSLPLADPFPTELELEGATQAIWRYPLDAQLQGLEVGLMAPALPFRQRVQTHPLALFKAARGDLRRTIALTGLFLIAWLLLIAVSEWGVKEPLARLANELKAERAPQVSRYPGWLEPLIEALNYNGRRRSGASIKLDSAPQPQRVPTEMLGSLPSKPNSLQAPTTAPQPALDERDTVAVEALDTFDDPEELEEGLEEKFQFLFREFIDTKALCGEGTHSIDYLKFRESVMNTRASLMSRHSGCVDIRFRVYVKNNKAALKAAPIYENEINQEDRD